MPVSGLKSTAYHYPGSLFYYHSVVYPSCELRNFRVPVRRAAPGIAKMCVCVCLCVFVCVFSCVRERWRLVEIDVAIIAR